MTLLQVTFRYTGRPNEAQMRAIGGISEVYGIRGIRFNEEARTMRVEFDASRLSETVVASLLRQAGIQLLDELEAPPVSQPV